MKTDFIATALYALLLLIGGLIGYFTAHSIPSLLMGAGFAALMAFCAWGIKKGCVYSNYSALALAAILMAFFAYRFWLTAKFMPGGLMAILSLGLIIILVKALTDRRNSLTQNH